MPDCAFLHRLVNLLLDTSIDVRTEDYTHYSKLASQVLSAIGAKVELKFSSSRAGFL